MSMEYQKAADAPDNNAASGRSGPNISLIIAAAVLAALLIFFFRNGDYTEIDFLFFEKRTTKRWSIIVAVLLGVALDRLLSIWWRRRRKQKNND